MMIIINYCSTLFTLMQLYALECDFLELQLNVQEMNVPNLQLNMK